MTTDALGLPYSGASKFIELKDDSTQTYVRPISTTPILGNKGSRIFAYIENHCLPVLLDTGADITVMSKSQLQALVRPSMSNDRKTVNLLMEEKSLSKVLVTYSCISVELASFSRFIQLTTKRRLLLDSTRSLQHASL